MKTETQTHRHIETLTNTQLGANTERHIITQKECETRKDTAYFPTSAQTHVGTNAFAQTLLGTNSADSARQVLLQLRDAVS